MGAGYQVAASSLATAATLPHAMYEFWNPHASIRCLVNEIHFVNTTAVVTNLGILRSQTRGVTPTTGPFVPVIQSSRSVQVAAPSGAALAGGTFGTQPVIANNTIFLERVVLPASIGAAVFFTYPLDDPLEVPPGTGIVVCTSLAAVTAASVATFVWRE